MIEFFHTIKHNRQNKDTHDVFSRLRAPNKAISHVELCLINILPANFLFYIPSKAINIQQTTIIMKIANQQKIGS